MIDLRGAGRLIRANVGDSISLAFTVTDAATGDPVDLTGYTWEAAVTRRGYDLVEFSSSVGGVSDNVVTFTLTPEQTRTVGSRDKVVFAIAAIQGLSRNTWLTGSLQLAPEGSGQHGTPSYSFEVVTEADLQLQVHAVSGPGNFVTHDGTGNAILRMVQMTLAQYQALPETDPNTYYVITGEP